MHWFDLRLLTIAFVMAVPIGIEREREDISAGGTSAPETATAFRRYDVAAFLLAVMYLISRLFRPIKANLDHGRPSTKQDQLKGK